VGGIGKESVSLGKKSPFEEVEKPFSRRFIVGGGVRGRKKITSMGE